MSSERSAAVPAADVRASRARRQRKPAPSAVEGLRRMTGIDSMPDFLLEIGCEEIPARMIDAASLELRERVHEAARP